MVYKKKYVKALTRRARVPQNKITKNIGINKLSKKIQKKNKSKTVNVKNNINWMHNILKNSNLIFFKSQLAKKQTGNNKNVKITKNNEIPSNPNEKKN